MKKKLFALTIMTVIASTSVTAKITDADITRDSAWTANQNIAIQIPQSVVEAQWYNYNKPPNEMSNSQQYPKGSSCGLYEWGRKRGSSPLREAGSVKHFIDIPCQGFSTYSQCPSGFTQVKIYEATSTGSNYTRNVVKKSTCIKN